MKQENISFTGLHHAVSLGNIEVSGKVGTTSETSPENTTKCAASKINSCQGEKRVQGSASCHTEWLTQLF